MRSNNRYAFGSMLLHVLFGVTPQQRLEPVTDFIEERGRKQKLGVAAAAVGAVGLLLALMRILKRLREA